MVSTRKRIVVNFQVNDTDKRMIDFLRYQVHGGRLVAAMRQAIRNDAMRYGYLDWVARLEHVEHQREEQLV